MNILHIIGNGFDLNLGLKTSYRDFYEYYKSQNATNEAIVKLKKSISENYNNWSDLELALGNYTSELKSLDDFDIVFDDIGENLASFLIQQEKRIEIDKIDINGFFEDLVRPENYLPLGDNNKIKSFKNKFITERWDVDIVTFNYTSILDKIVDNQKRLPIGYHARNEGKVIFRGIEHIHGFCNERMILGVNDISQIKNKDFQENEDIIEAIIKQNCNRSYRHLIDDSFRNKIEKSNIICIFGSSIGDTDKIWWELIGEKLKKESIPILIFTKGEEVVSPRAGYKNNRTERKMRNYFLNKIGLNESEKEEVKANIFILVDKGMFKILKD